MHSLRSQVGCSGKQKEDLAKSLFWGGSPHQPRPGPYDPATW